MNTKLSWILLGLMLCSLVSWGSTFTPGMGRPNIPPGKRELTPKQVSYELTSSLKMWHFIMSDFYLAIDSPDFMRGTYVP